MSMKIYIVKTDYITDETLSNLCLAVDPEQRQRIHRFINKEDKVRTLIGDILTRSIIAEQLKLKNEQINFGKSKFGKPYLKSFKDFHFNISHSGEFIVCAISSNPIGIDIEQVKCIDYKNIAEKFFTESEVKYILDSNYTDSLSRFYRIWTLKESYIKCHGMGLSIPLKSFSIEIVDETIKDIVDSEYAFLLRTIYIDKEYSMAVCSQNKNISENVVTVNQSLLIDNYLKLTGVCKV